MQPILIDFTQPRKVAIIDSAERIYTFQIARISQPVWLKYFSKIDSRTRRRDDKSEPIVDMTAAREYLLDTVLLSAEGYEIREGNITGIPNWKQKLPPSHRSMLFSVLVAAEACDSDETPPFGFETVCMRALWSANDEGKMVRVSPLIHRFETPTFEQERRYRRDHARSVIIGGSRQGGDTVYPGAQPTSIALYDEMIDSVEGYALNGEPLQGREMIAREMDAFHKCLAVELLFNPPGLSEVKEEEKRVDEAA